MSAAPRSRLVNPLLGTYFGIFASVLAAVVLLLMLLEQLGVEDATLRTSMIGGFIALYCVIGIAAFTRLPAEYFASGRRVPAFFGGLNLALAALGGTGLAALSGALFLIGFDALCIGVGIVGGFVCMTVLLMPYLRKFGAYSIPAYLGQRYESPILRIVSAALLSVPTLLLLMAELKMAAATAAWLTQVSEGLVMAMLVGTLALIVTPGGMRSLTWSGAAAAIAAIAALIVPVVIVAVLTTNLPLPQLSYGPVLRALIRTETLQEMPAPIATGLTFELPRDGLAAIARRFATPFSSIGPTAFVLAGFAVMLGIAGSPTLLSRAGTTPGVYEARKAMGWAALVLGVVLLTMSGVAVFLRDIVVSQLSAAQGQPPDWFATLLGLGLAGLDTQAPVGSLASYAFDRDTVLIALPVAAGFPAVLVYLAAAGIVSAALAGACAAATTLGTMLAEDVINAPRSELVSNGVRVMCARLGIVLAACGGGWMAAVTPGDPLELFLWSLALSGSTAFPVVALSIWWKRGTTWGALAGLISGFVVAAGAIMTGEITSLGLPGALAAVLGAPLSFAAILVVSILTPAPPRRVLELVRDLRIPGGETLYDREVRLALLQHRQQL